MEKKHIVIIMLFSLAIDAHTTTKKKWFPRREKMSQFQVYVQDILTGATPSNVAVAMANSTLISPTRFGLVYIMDDPIRIEPTPDSKIVGRAQGILAQASLEEASFHMTFDLVFTSGAFDGSTLNIVTHNPFLNAPHREFPIVGGNGVFRLARGFIESRTVFRNATTGDAFFQYNVTVFHY